MNVIIKTEIGNITLPNVTRVQETNGTLEIMAIKPKVRPTKVDLDFMRKILDYMKIKSSVKEYASSIEYRIDASSKIEVKLTF